MRKFIISLLFILPLSSTSLVGQCNFIGNSISTGSQEMQLQLYTPSFFFISPGEFNTYHWVITNTNGTPVATETRQYVDFASNFYLFDHTVPLTDSMVVDFTVTNSSTGVVCQVIDTVAWVVGTFVSIWTIVSNGTGILLPVNLSDFNASVKGNNIILNWQTSSEQNNEGFEVQKSKNGVSWEKIDFVPGKGNSTNIHNYSLIDKNPYNGINYYRLKQIDFDGKYVISDIVHALYKKSINYQLEIYPNPSAGSINIHLQNDNQEVVHISIVDILGRVIWEDTIQKETLSYAHQAEIKEAGMFFLVTSQNNQINTQKILVTD